MKTSRVLVRRIVTAINRIDGLYDTGAKWSDVKANTLYLLYALDDGMPHTQKSICDDWLLPRTTINTIVKECEAGGYVELKPMAGHRRDLQVCLTDAGKVYAHEKLALIYRAEDQALEKTLEECSPAFISQLELFSANLKSAFDRLIKE